MGVWVCGPAPLLIVNLKLRSKLIRGFGLELDRKFPDEGGEFSGGADAGAAGFEADVVAVGGDALFDFEGLGGVALVAQCVGAFDVAVAFAGGVAGDGLLACDVKEGADGEFDLFSLRGVGDAALSDEVALSGAVLLVHPDDPGGQRDAEVVVLRVGQFDNVGKMKFLLAVFLEVAAGEFAVAGEVDVCFVGEADLFLLVVGDGFPEGDFVDVVTGERLFLHFGSGHGHGDVFLIADAAIFNRAGGMNFPGEAGDLRMGVGDAGAVVDGDPADEIEALFAEVEDVVTLPADAGGEVLQIDPELPGLGGFDVPHEAGASDHVFGDGGEGYLRRFVEGKDFACPFLPYHDDGCSGEEGAVREGGVAAVGVEVHGVVDALFEHRVEGDEVVDVVLRIELRRDPAEAGDDTGGNDAAGDPFIDEPLRAGRDVGFAGVVDEGAVVVVDRDSEIGGGLRDDGVGDECRDEQGEEGDGFHDVFLCRFYGSIAGGG